MHALPMAAARSQSIELLPEADGRPTASGAITSVLEGNSMAYRSFRLSNLHMSR